jgi:hypothetical protein
MNDFILGAIGGAIVAVILIAWFYEIELGHVMRQRDDAKLDLADTRYKLMQAQAEITSLKNQSTWSFAPAQPAFGNGVPDSDLVPLFDSELMLGNHD